MKERRLDGAAKWTLIGIPVLFIIGSMMHFLYGWTGNNEFIGFFAPVNESIWEHIKLIELPIIAWWCLYCMIGGASGQLDYDKWLTGGLVALVTGMVTMPLIFYFYTQAFGVEFLVVDILIVLVNLILGQLLGLHIYRHGKGIPAYIVMIIFAGIVLLMMWWTYNPPRLPIFMDGPTGTYGIYKE